MAHRRFSDSGVPISASVPNECWAFEVCDIKIAYGRRVHIFGVIDLFSRECLHLEVVTRISLSKITTALDVIVSQRKKPSWLVSDYAFVWQGVISTWCAANDVSWNSIWASSPSGRGAVERVFGRLSVELVLSHQLRSREELSQGLQAWREWYNATSNLAPKYSRRKLAHSARGLGFLPGIRS